MSPERHYWGVQLHLKFTHRNKHARSFFQVISPCNCPTCINYVTVRPGYSGSSPGSYFIYYVTLFWEFFTPFVYDPLSLPLPVPFSSDTRLTHSPPCSQLGPPGKLPAENAGEDRQTQNYLLSSDVRSQPYILGCGLHRARNGWRNSSREDLRA